MVLFWQVANQSLNMGVNWANANKSNPMSLLETASMQIKDSPPWAGSRFERDVLFLN